MEGKGSDTEDEFEDLLEDAMGDFPDKPHKDPPPPYKPPANPDPEIALSPAPQGGVLDVVVAEDLPDIDMKIRESEFKMKGEIIKKNNELTTRIDKLETMLKICGCDTDWEKINKMSQKIQSRFRGNKDRSEMEGKHPDYFINRKVTKGWIVIRGCDAFNNDTPEPYPYPYMTEDGIPSSVEGSYTGKHGSVPQGSDLYKRLMRGDPVPGHMIEEKDMKQITIDYGYVGFTVDNKRMSSYDAPWTRYNWWLYPSPDRKYQNKDHNQMLENTIKAENIWLIDTHIAPGVSLHLIKKKIKEGFVIEFEDPLDAREMDQLMGVVSGYKKKKKSKRKKSKKKKSRRSSKKKKKSKRKKSRRRK